MIARVWPWAALPPRSGAPGPINSRRRRSRAGCRLLFDGKTMKNWDDPRRKKPPGDAWTIEDGCLKAKAKPRITEDLFSAQTCSTISNCLAMAHRSGRQ